MLDLIVFIGIRIKHILEIHFSSYCFVVINFDIHYCRAAGALPQTTEDTIGRNPCVRSSSTITMLSSTRFEMGPHVESFLNSRFVMPLPHLEIQKFDIDRPITEYGSDLVLTERTSTRKSTHKMKNRSWIWWFPEVFAASLIACGAPKPCGAGSSRNNDFRERISSR